MYGYFSFRDGGYLVKRKKEKVLKENAFLNIYSYIFAQIFFYHS